MSISAVTGASGHIGSALVRELLARGHAVRALVHSDVRGLEGLAVERFRGDLADEQSLTRAFAGADVVFHAAGLISLSGPGAGARGLVSVNVDGTRRVIAACRAAGVRRLVHFSSVEALSAQPLDREVDEERPLNDARSSDPYAASKAAGESEVRRAVQGGMDGVILYPTGVIGPYDFKPSLLGRAIIAIARGEFPALVAGGFDWVDVRDVAQAAATAGERARAGSRYLLGGHWASLAQLAALVCAVTGARVPRLVVPSLLAQAWAPVAAAAALVSGTPPLFTGYTLRTISDNRRVSRARAAADLGYSPRPLEDTVRDTCLWLAAGGKLAGVRIGPGAPASGESGG